MVSSELGLLEVFAGCCKLHSSSTVLAYQAIKETSPGSIISTYCQINIDDIYDTSP